MKKFISILFFLFFWLQYSFWFGKHGVCEFFHIKNNPKMHMINMLRLELKCRNNKLISEINDFINNTEESIEDRARNDLNLIKSDEIFYHVVALDKKY